MTAYEMMLSESQERMLMVLHPEERAAAEAVFVKWGLDFAVIGRTTDTLRFVIKHGGETKVDLPIKELGDQAPLYDRPHVASPKLAPIDPASVAPPMGDAEALVRLMAVPDLASKRWVWEQYDHLILGNSVIRPGGDAAVIRIGDGPKGLALTTDVTQRYCEADPVEGGRQAVAEAWRNITATGALPRAATDNLNFGNPEKPEVMGQLVGCVRGIGEACRALDFPIVSGNVSLYNESAGRGILPTPSIGGVGIVADVTRTARIGFASAGEAILLVGETRGWLGQSLYLRELCGREEGAPPPVDLAAEKAAGAFVRAEIVEHGCRTAHDVSDGGLAVALAEMALAAGIGATVELPGDVPAHAFLFGEDQGRYLLAVPSDEVEAVLARAAADGVPCLRLGATGGSGLRLGAGVEPVGLDVLRAAHEGWMPTFMG